MPNEETIQKMSIVDPIQVNVNIPNFEGKPGRDGTDGRDGDDAYRIAVRNGFLGTEKEWLLTLKGQDGKSASAPTARQELLKNNIWCEDETVDSVFTAIIGNWGKPMPRTEFKPLTVTSMVDGQKSTSISGEPHYKVKIVGYDAMTEIGGDGYATLTLPMPLGEDDYSIEYYNFSNSKVGDAIIRGSQTGGTPDDTYEADGIKYSLYGKNLTVNVAGFNASRTSNQIFLGKWQPSQVEKVLVKVSRPTNLSIMAIPVFQHMGSIPILVDHPENLRFENFDNWSTPVQIGGIVDGTKPTSFNTSDIEWDETSNRYINVGSAVDHL